MLCRSVSFLLPGKGASLSPGYGCKAETCRSLAFSGGRSLEVPFALDTLPPARVKSSANQAT
ncbi:hypothetical protein QE368_001756 [Asaia bogorensis NBRC 16594]|nr:hypothetical protein [Asaia bogorensis NBRC 16594]